uniref:Uncharacterized protein n=1 Tax=Oryza sativa subsp. japonica TaxID=39947 RepID=Q5Z7A6_ORYSJ|nr:hypothetical protein [Oryza sativa Japonica Group]
MAGLASNLVGIGREQQQQQQRPRRDGSSFTLALRPTHSTSSREKTTRRDETKK